MKKLVVVLVVLALATTLFAQGTTETSAAAEAKPVTFNVATSYKVGSDYINTLQAACDTITEKTNGAILFQIYGGAQLGSTADVTELMLNGSNIMAGLGMANLSGYVKEAAIPGYPYVVNNYDEVKKLFHSKWWASVKQKLSDQWNMIPVMCFSVGYRNTVGAVPIKKASDIKNHIFRIGLGTVGQDFVTACGGTPTTTPSFSDCYSGIQTGMFDLCEADTELLYTSALYEVSKCLSVTHHMINPCMFAVHKDYWDKISKENQQIMLDELEKAGQEIWDNYSVKETKWIAKYADQGVQIIPNEDIDVESFKQTIPKIMELQGVSTAEFDKVMAAVAGTDK